MAAGFSALLAADASRLFLTPATPATRLREPSTTAMAELTG